MRVYKESVDGETADPYAEKIHIKNSSSVVRSYSNERNLLLYNLDVVSSGQYISP